MIVQLYDRAASDCLGRSGVNGTHSTHAWRQGGYDGRALSKSKNELKPCASPMRDLSHPHRVSSLRSCSLLPACSRLCGRGVCRWTASLTGMRAVAVQSVSGVESPSGQGGGQCHGRLGGERTLHGSPAPCVRVALHSTVRDLGCMCVCVHGARAQGALEESREHQRRFAQITAEIARSRCATASPAPYRDSTPRAGIRWDPIRLGR